MQPPSPKASAARECKMGIRVITIQLEVLVDQMDLVDGVDWHGRPPIPVRPTPTDSFCLFPSSLWQISI